MTETLENKVESASVQSEEQNTSPQAVYLLPPLLDPSVVDRTAAIHTWIRTMRKHTKALLVVHNGLYPPHTLAQKLYTSKKMIEHLMELKQLRLRENTKEYARWTPLDPRSIAELLSAIYRKPLSEIFVEETRYNPEKHAYEPREHIRKLWRAYAGDHWFETFKAIQQEKITAGAVKLPLLCEWHLIPRATISKIIQVSQRTLKELDERGFLIPKEGTFTSRSLYNIVDTKALAQLFALLEDKPLSKKLRYTVLDSTFSRIRAHLINKRLVPYLQRHTIDPYKEYTIPQLEMKTGIDESTLRSWIYTLKAFPTTDVPFQGERTRVAVKGIDVALYALREEGKKQLTTKEVAGLFGITESQVDVLRLPLTEEGVYGAQQYVYPLYNVFASDIRKRYCKDSKRQHAILPPLLSEQESETNL